MVTDSVKKVRKRKDVSDKIQKRKVEEEYVVKASLAGSLKGDEKERLQLQECLKSWSDALSQRLNFASRSLTLILKQCFHVSKNFKDTPLPDFLDQTFIRQLMLGLENISVDHPSIKELFQQHPNLLKHTKRFQADRNLYSAASRSFLTNLKTSLNYIFEKRLLKLIFYKKDLENWKENETIKLIKHSILGEFLPTDIKEMDLETKYPSLVTFITEIKHFLDLKDGKVVTETWLKQHPYQVVRFYAYILDQISQTDQPVKLFNLLPLTTIKNHFVTLDASCFLGIFKAVGILKEDAKIESITKDLLESVFKLPRSKGFTGTIQTDGTSICFHFRRTKVKYTENELKQHLEDIKQTFLRKETRRLGCDPGRECIYTIVEEGTDKVWKLSRKEYYSKSGIYKSRERTKDWTKNIQPSLDALSQVSSKGISLDTYNEYLKVFIDTYDSIWNEYSKKCWAAQRLRLYGGKKRCFDQFWNNVLGKEGERVQECVIAYGSAKFASGGKGEVSVPTSRSFQECKKQKGLKVLVTDEFRTSKLDHRTHQLLHTVKIQGADYPLRGLLWCCSTSQNEQGYFVNRDVNAAWNILKLCMERPDIFTRKKKMRRLPKQEVRKVIKKQSRSYKPRT